ncbi:MAG: signal recognition particle-docking protein FtsY [Candidatus Bathyarchaeota archaeon]|nr:MAG: signal recognition particle-docking protein FtsY [Candidatus Bathyarchaeota archaeon]
MFEKLKAGLDGLVGKITTTELKAEHLDPILSEFKLNLVENDVAFPVAERICNEMVKRLDGVEVKRLQDRRELVKKNLQEVLMEILSSNSQIDLIEQVKLKKQQGAPLIVIFVGINGTGKTTTIAKVAKLFMKRGFSVVLAGSDTYRAGSIEQLEEHARRLRVKMIKHKYGGDPAAVAFDAIKHAEAHGVDVVLVDTAGRIQTNKNLMNELAKIKRVVNPDLTLLVVDALTGNDAATQAEEFNASVSLDGTILTKVDADVKGGSALSVTHITGKPILFIGVGQAYDDLRSFTPKEFMQMILK